MERDVHSTRSSDIQHMEYNTRLLIVLVTVVRGYAKPGAKAVMVVTVGSRHLSLVDR